MNYDDDEPRGATAMDIKIALFLTRAVAIIDHSMMVCLFFYLFLACQHGIASFASFGFAR